MGRERGLDRPGQQLIGLASLAREGRNRRGLDRPSVRVYQRERAKRGRIGRGLRLAERGVREIESCGEVGEQRSVVGLGLGDRAKVMVIVSSHLSSFKSSPHLSVESRWLTRAHACSGSALLFTPPTHHSSASSWPY